MSGTRRTSRRAGQFRAEGRKRWAANEWSKLLQKTSAMDPADGRPGAVEEVSIPIERKGGITDEYVEKKVASGRQYCVRLYKVGPNRNQAPGEAEQIQRAHLRYLFQLRAEGKMLINGPVLDDPKLKGLSIFNTTDKEEVKRLSDGDPAVQAGRLIYEIYDWFGVPVDCLPK